MLQVLLLPRLVLVKQSQELSPEARTERKRKRKRSTAEEQDEEERDLLKSSLPWAGKTAKRHECIYRNFHKSERGKQLNHCCILPKDTTELWRFSKTGTERRMK